MLLPLFFTGCAAPAQVPAQTITVEISDPPGPTQRVEVQLGAEVTLRITTARDDRAHLHGYEVELDTKAGQPTDLVFKATMSGSYELESHLTNSVWLNVVVK